MLFCNLAKLRPDDWGMSEHATLLEAIKVASSYDQLNVANLASFDVLFTLIQTIEYCYLDRAQESSKNSGQRFGPRLTLEEQSAFMGTTRSQLCRIAPSLISHLEEHVKEKSELARSFRLAREEKRGTSERI